MDGAGAAGTATNYAREDHRHPTDTSLAPFAILRGYIDGVILSTPGGTGGFTVAPGTAMDSTNSNAMTLAASMNKNGAAAWGVGQPGQGSLDTGAIAANTWYHVHLIKRVDTGVVDVLTSLSPTAPILPSPYTLFRRIGAMKTGAGGAWLKFIQNGDAFTWDVAVVDVNATNPGIAAVMRTLSVPTGVKTVANLAVQLAADTNADYLGGVLITDPAIADTPAGLASIFSVAVYSAAAAQLVIGFMVQAMTNTSAQVRSRIEHSSAGAHLSLITHGWTDTRGKNA